MNNLRVGELNGRWATLLKITLVAVPFLTALTTTAFIPWACWVTGNIYSSRRTTEIVQQIQLEQKDMKSEMRELPPIEWKARIIRLEADSIVNREDHMEIKIVLARIADKLGVVQAIAPGK